MTQQMYQAPAPPVGRHAAPRTRRRISPILVAAGVAAGALVVAGGIGLVITQAGGGRGDAALAPSVPEAEEACRAAFQASYEQEDQEVKARYAREEPDFRFRTSMDDVNIWSAKTVGSTVVVSGDVEWTLTSLVFGPQSQTARYTCTATVKDGRVATNVS